ncbi:MAG: SDR family NAD(P)-dependent oxidoreductase [Clostridia bacterium]
MKYAFVTGGAGGLGGQACQVLADNGWTVFAADINQEALDKINYKNIIPVQADITKVESLEKARDFILTKTDKLDAVVNFAGMMNFTSLVENSPRIMEIAISVNLMGMINVNYVLFPLIDAAKGRIINVSSEIGWLKPQPFVAPYSVTKHAVDTYNDALRRELNIVGLKVIKIQPGSFKTNMHNAAERTFDRLISETTHYKNALSSMKKIMTHELVHANDPKIMAKTILTACTAKNPKINYRVKNSKKLRFLNIFPDKLIDKIYMAVIK